MFHFMNEQLATPSILIGIESLKIRLQINELLNSHFVIIEASTASEIMNILSHQIVQFLILDEALDGINICKSLREIKRFTYLPILLILKNADDSKTVKEAIKAGVTNFLNPPLTQESLLTSILVADRFTKTMQEMTTFSQKLKGLAEHDPLTNLYNRYFLFDHGSKEVAKSLRGHFPLSLLMIDIDKFKNVNDLHGHLIGDEVLSELASFIMKSQRSYDIAARYGGEEFVILLPNTTKEQAIIVGEKIRTNVEKQTFTSLNIKITLSVGVSSLNGETTSLEHLIQAADTALYQSKRKGRNQVSVA